MIQVTQSWLKGIDFNEGSRWLKWILIGCLCCSLLGCGSSGPSRSFLLPTSLDPASLDPRTTFSIDLRFVDAGLTVSQQASISAAAARWSTLIQGDLPDIPLGAPLPPCIDNTPPLNQSIDDLVIDISIGPIDGPGNTLGLAAICLLRTESALPAYGAIRFDQNDLPELVERDLLGAVALHEITHVLGFGILWPARGLVANVDTTLPVYLGFQGVAQYAALGGQGLVPVEGQGGTGVENVHWRESVFGSELMTGTLNTGGGNPLSRLTVGAILDLGYRIEQAVADPYVIPDNVTATATEFTVQASLPIKEILVTDRMRWINAQGQLVN